MPEPGILLKGLEVVAALIPALKSLVEKRRAMRKPDVQLSAEPQSNTLKLAFFHPGQKPVILQSVEILVYRPGLLPWTARMQQRLDLVDLHQRLRRQNLRGQHPPDPFRLAFSGVDGLAEEHVFLGKKPLLPGRSLVVPLDARALMRHLPNVPPEHSRLLLRVRVRLGDGSLLYSNRLPWPQ